MNMQDGGRVFLEEDAWRRLQDYAVDRAGVVSSKKAHGMRDDALRSFFCVALRSLYPDLLSNLPCLPALFANAQ